MSVQESHSDSSLLEDGMRLMKQCPLCQTDYNFDNIYLIEEEDNAHLVHITCTVCKGKMLAILMMSSFGMSSVGMITDLDNTDVERLYKEEPMSADDVLELYQLLHTERSFEGSVVTQLPIQSL